MKDLKEERSSRLPVLSEPTVGDGPKCLLSVAGASNSALPGGWYHFIHGPTVDAHGRGYTQEISPEWGRHRRLSSHGSREPRQLPEVRCSTGQSLGQSGNEPGLA